MKTQTVTDIMTPNVKTVNTGQKLSQVRRMLVDYPFHHIPVTSGDRLVGIISATDMIRLVFEGYGNDDRSIDAVLDSQFTVEEVMNTNLITVEDGATIRDAAVKLSSGSFHSLPVVSDDGRLEGIVTSTDLIRYLAEQC
jgi:CBS domain-containing protein